MLGCDPGSSAFLLSQSTQSVSRTTVAGVDSPSRGHSVTYAAAAFAVASQLFTNVYPVFVGALASSGRATPAQLGRLATVEYLCMALAAMFAGKILPLTRLRSVAVIASLIEIAAVVATTYVSGDELLPVRAIFAGACGVHVWIQYEFVARSHNPGRLVGLCTTVVVIAAVLMSWLASSYVVPAFGVDGVILFFGLPSFVAILGALMLPRTVAAVPTHPQTNAAPKQSGFSSGSLWLLASAGAWSAWINVLWVYSEPLSRALGMSETTSQAFVVASLISSLAGAGLGALMAERLPSGAVLTAGLTICMAQVIAFLLGVGSTAYVIWFCPFGFVGYFLVPFFVKALAAADSSRQSVVFFPTAQYSGASLGPLIASFVVSPGQYRGGLLVDLGCIAVAIGALWIDLFYRRVSRGSTALEPPAA